MKIPANSLYFRLNGPDQTLTRNRPARGAQRVNSGTSKSSSSSKARIRRRPKPFPLNGPDLSFLWDKYGLTHGIFKGRSYFSVPPTAEGALWLLNRGFTQDQIEFGPFIGATMLRADAETFDLEPTDYVLIPTSKVLDSRGEQIREVLPANPRAAAAFDIHPICSHYLQDHQTVYWTGTATNADCIVSAGGAAIALHGTYPGGVVPTVEELQRLYEESNLDKLLLKHLFVLDSDVDFTGPLFQTMENLAEVLPGVRVTRLKPWVDGSLATLANVCWGGGKYSLTSYEWGDEPWNDDFEDGEPWEDDVEDDRPWGQMPLDQEL